MRLRDIIGFVSIGLLVTSGCTSTSKTPPPPQPEADVDAASPLREWKKVFVMRATELSKARKHAGYLCHEYTLEDREGQYLIYDLDRRRIGFILPSGRVYRYTTDRKGNVDAEYLAHLGLEAGTAHILGADGAAEFDDITEEDVQLPAETGSGS